MWNWSFNASNGVAVTGWSFWVGILGLLLTLVGFWFTFRQIAKTKGAAEAVRLEVGRIQLSMQRYDIGQEVSRADYALSVARKHFSNRAWEDGANSYYDVRRSLILIKSNVKDFDVEIIKSVEKATIYIDRLCERVDRGELNNADVDDVAKLRSVMRQHDQLIGDMRNHIQKGIF